MRIDFITFKMWLRKFRDYKKLQIDKTSQFYKQVYIKPYMDFPFHLYNKEKLSGYSLALNMYF